MFRLVWEPHLIYKFSRDQLCDLSRVECCAFAEVIAAHKEIKRVIIIEGTADSTNPGWIGINDICRSWPDSVFGIIEKFDTCRTL